MKRSILGMAMLVGAIGTAAAGWGDWQKTLGDLVGGTAQAPGGQTAGTALSQPEMASGLKEALHVGVQRAIDGLGRQDGFLADPQVRIPLPAGVEQAAAGLRLIGQGQLADSFVTTMNRAAESAVPEAANIFADTISRMTLEDAKGILNGPDDAATQYFREHSYARLLEAVLPVIRQATDQAGVTAAYKALIGQVSQGGVMGSFLSPQQLDLDRYVGGKALDGVFLKLAEEEQKIRTDPVARSTELLKTVFGAVAQ